MELSVDRAKWQVRQNAGPPRNQSATKQLATTEHVKDMLEKEVIEPSSAAHYSHVHLTPKPHQKPDEPVNSRMYTVFRCVASPEYLHGYVCRWGLKGPRPIFRLL